MLAIFQLPSVYVQCTIWPAPITPSFLTSAAAPTEGVELTFNDDALREIAHLATAVNATTEDIGARRLHTIIERVIEDISFEAPERRGEQITIDAAFVVERIGEVAADEDLSSYIL